MKKLFFLLILLITLSTGLAQDIVNTESGAVRATHDQTGQIRIFRAIPYAAPPIGDLRWKAPQNVAKWSGVRESDIFAPMCRQAEREPRPIIQRGYVELQSEDCLYLNIWTAAKSANEKRPVMVWIFGGAFVSGNGSMPIFDGEALAKKGVILVNFNYRVGVFGFFAHPALSSETSYHGSGNYGLLDQLAALQWIKRNIAKFGGDPNNVTIFGQSSGSASVNLQVTSPLTKGLIHRAIGETGSILAGPVSVKTLSESEQIGVKFFETVGAKSLAEMRSKSADELLDPKYNTAARGGFPIVIDGYFLPQSPAEIYAQGKQQDIPILIGSNSDEAQLPPPSFKAEKFIADVKAAYGKQADELLQMYPANSDETARHSQKALQALLNGGHGMRVWARAQSKTGKSKVFVYYFSRRQPTADGKYSENSPGAFHGAEIPYAFNNLRLRYVPWMDVDQKLADVISSYWTNFAKNGDPNGKGLPVWERYEPNKDMVFELGEQIRLIPQPFSKNMDWLDAFAAKKLAVKPD